MHITKNFNQKYQMLKLATQNFSHNLITYHKKFKPKKKMLKLGQSKFNHNLIIRQKKFLENQKLTKLVQKKFMSMGNMTNYEFTITKSKQMK